MLVIGKEVVPSDSPIFFFSQRSVFEVRRSAPQVGTIKNRCTLCVMRRYYIGEGDLVSTLIVVGGPGVHVDTTASNSVGYELGDLLIGFLSCFLGQVNF